MWALRIDHEPRLIFTCNPRDIYIYRHWAPDSEFRISITLIKLHVNKPLIITCINTVLTRVSRPYAKTLELPWKVTRLLKGPKPSENLLTRYVTFQGNFNVLAWSPLARANMVFAKNYVINHGPDYHVNIKMSSAGFTDCQVIHFTATRPIKQLSTYVLIMSGRTLYDFW